MKHYKVTNNKHTFCECCGISLALRARIWTNNLDIACSENCLIAIEAQDAELEPFCLESVSRLEAAAEAGVWGHA